MTCIVGLVDKDKNVWLGGDSAGVGGYDLVILKDPKVFRNGQFLVGCAGSIRLSNLLECAWTPPEYFAERDTNLKKFLVVSVIDSLRDCFKNKGVTQTSNGQEMIDGGVLLGFAGHLYTIEADYQIREDLCNYGAIGCGANYANAVLHANPDLPPQSRVELALKAAEAHNAGVRGPFTIECLKHAATV